MRLFKNLGVCAGIGVATGSVIHLPLERYIINIYAFMLTESIPQILYNQSETLVIQNQDNWTVWLRYQHK